MSIDVKEWAARMVQTNREHFPNTLQLTMEYATAAAQVYIDLMRAVIADEAAKAQPDEPRAEGDVPEWFASMIRSCWFADDSQVATCWARWQPEFARRVEQATMQVGANAAAVTVKLRHQIQRLTQATADKDRRIAELETACQEIGNTLSKRIDGLRQQLAEATRPVEDVSWDKLGVELQRHIEQVIRTTATLWLIENVKPLFQRERAARVAAESERDELRAAVEVHGQYVYVTFGDGATWFHVGNHLRSETFCGACLNAFREEKWKVTK